MTSSFDLTALPQAIFSPPSSWTDSSNAGHDQRQMQGSGMRIDFVATGTDCVLNVLSGVTQPCGVQVDGGTTTFPATAGGYLWSTMTLFSGLTDAPHTVTVYFFNGNTWVERGTNGKTVTVTGAAPAIETVASLTSGGHTSQAGWLGGWSGTQTRFSDYAGSWSGENMPTASPGGYSGSPSNYINGTTCEDAVFRCKLSNSTTTPPLFWLFLGTSTGPVYVSTDGGAEVAYNIPAATGALAGGGFGWASLFTPTDAAEHEYAIRAGQPSSGGGGLYPIAVMTFGGTGYNRTTSNYPNPPTKPTIGLFGDSHFAPSGSGSGGSRNGVGGLIYQRSPTTAIVDNAAASGTTTYLRGQSNGAVYAITDAPTVPTLTIIQYGDNDRASGSGITTAQFQAAYYTMVHKVLAGDTSASPNVTARSSMGILCMLLLPRSGYDNTAPNAAIVAAIGSGGDGGGNALTTGQKARVDTLDPSVMGLVPGGTDYTTNFIGDGQHLNDLGNAIVFSHCLPWTEAAQGRASYSVSGLANGPVGVAQTVTVHAPSGGKFDGSTTITVSDGTVTANCTPAAGASTGTTTYTPASAGSKTLSFANNRNLLVDPSSQTYTVIGTAYLFSEAAAALW